MKPELFAALREALAARELVAVATVVAGDRTGRQLLLRPGATGPGSLGSAELDQSALAAADDAFRDFASRRVTLDAGAESVDVFLDVHPPPARLVIVGAVHVAVHLIAYAERLGFHTVVVDPRTAFATRERFAHAGELLRAWPQDALPELGLDRATYVAVLSHDLKIDVPALVHALASPARYVGALGSKKTQAKRAAKLEEAGVAAVDIARIRSPIGLDLGGRRAEEIALAVMAEIVAASHGK